MPKGKKKICRALAIDPGTKRIGLAVSDELGLTAQGLDTYELAGEDAFIAFLKDLQMRYNIEVIVLGEPRSMSGGEIEATERSRELARLIERELDMRVILVDERMTSLEAERVLKQAGRIREAGKIDRLAAVLLLQGYLDGLIR
ncbi:MAG: Holliday junction resolvase RuvX [Candidatus Krumholzibacteria bacterium]|nr:Holliday junction resolvase RuvX [Candidatus Krumholzibacteria bacterium]